MDRTAICAKFGLDYLATEHTFTMGIDRRFTTAMARRFCGRSVLETCTGGGFTTIALARVAAHVVTVEIEPAHQIQAKHNLAMAGLADRVMFVLADIMDENTWNRLPPVDAAFLDPDWAVTGPAHVHRFVNSSTHPPADALLDRTLSATPNVALVLPPTLNVCEFDSLPPHERQKLYIDQSHELYCLYFGELAISLGDTEFRV
jgi:SAM-dependent methyltransferase